MNWFLSSRFEWWYKWGSVGPIAFLLCSFSFRVLEPLSEFKEVT